MHLIDLLPNKWWYWVAASYDALGLPENKDKNSAHHGETALPSRLPDSHEWAGQAAACSAECLLGMVKALGSICSTQ